MKKFNTLLGAAVLAVASLGSAHAAPITVTNAAVTIWNYAAGGGIDNPAVQALPSAVVGQTADYTGFYTGQINFFLPGGASDTIGAFAASSGGTFNAALSDALKATTLSTGNFDITTIFNFVFTITTEIVGAIDHDDGISIWNADNTQIIVNSSYPTSSIETTFDLMPGTYSLWYSAANDLPEELIMDGRTVPEPATLALLGLGLLGLGTIRRRKAA